MEDKMPVRFLEAHPPYNATEVAGFRPDRAARLIAMGIAEPFVAETRDPVAVTRDPVAVTRAAGCAPGSLAGVDFTSDDAAEAAANLGLESVDFTGAGSGKGGAFTKADVTKLAKAK